MGNKKKKPTKDKAPSFMEAFFAPAAARQRQADAGKKPSKRVSDFQASRRASTTKKKKRK